LGKGNQRRFAGIAAGETDRRLGMGQFTGGEVIGGEVIRFPVEMADRRERGDTADTFDAGKTATILFFTGVRYSRLEETGGGGRNASGEAGRSRKRRRSKA
jgi:hypothetical protein